MSILAWIEDQKRLKLLNAPKYVHPASDSSKGLWTRCDKCGVILYIKHLKENQRVCFGCSYHLQMSSQERVENILDKDTWRPFDETVSPCDPLDFQDQKEYTDRLQDAQERTGLQDAIQTGSGMVDGIPVALGVMDFDFMGGSMGSVVGEKITRLIEYATQEGLTLILVCASGGARMQEGVFSLMQMAKISSALQVYQSCANLLYISILTSPTTGGVTASFAMLGDIIFAEPKALIGFAGRRVIEQTLCEDLPEDFQSSEYMLHHGLLDLIVPRRFLRQALSETIRLYKNAPFKQPGRIPFGVQNPISFLTEEKLRRRWGNSAPSSIRSIGKNQSSTYSTSVDQISSSTQSYAPAKNTSHISEEQEAITNTAYNTPSNKESSSVIRSTSSAQLQIDSEKAENNSQMTQTGEGRDKNDQLKEKLIDFSSAQGGPSVNTHSKSVITGKTSRLKENLSYGHHLKRESIEYREILTSFQTMFTLFSKEMVARYDSGVNTSQTSPIDTSIRLTGVDQTLSPLSRVDLNANVKDSKATISSANFGQMVLPDLNLEKTTENQTLLRMFRYLSEKQNLSDENIEVRSEVGKQDGQRAFINTDHQHSDFSSKNLEHVPNSIHSLMGVGDSNDIDFLNQAMELAATESVEWRAFYVHQKVSKTTGFLEDFLQPKFETENTIEEFTPQKPYDNSIQNMLFYRSICRGAVQSD